MIHRKAKIGLATFLVIGFGFAVQTLGGTFGLGDVASAVAVSRPTAPSLPGFPILQGATSVNSTQIAISLPKSQTFKVVLSDGKGEIKPAGHRAFSRPFSDTQVAHYLYKGLKLNQIYNLRVFDSEGKIADQRTLSTLDTRPRRARLALVSCMADKFAEAGRVLWNELVEMRPDVLFFVGDNVYADSNGPADPKNLWVRYVETRERLVIFRTPHLIPSFATWDDHDYGVNDGDFTYPHKHEAHSVFDAFFPQWPVFGAITRGPGVSSHFKIFGQRVFFMDDRSFRSEVDSKGIKTHWGEDQNRWLSQGLKTGAGPVWLVSGTQFFGAYHPYESFEKEHPEDLKRLIAELRSLPWPTVFVSGDRHLSEILEARSTELGYRTFELTSSGIHSYTSSSSEPPPPAKNRIIGPYREMNYMIVDLSMEAASTRRPIVSLKVHALGAGKKMGFAETLQIRR